MSAPPASPPLDMGPPASFDSQEYVVILTPLQESFLFCNRWKCVFCDRTIYRHNRFLLRVDARGEAAVSNHMCHEKECDRLQKSRQIADASPAAEPSESGKRRCNWVVFLVVLLSIFIAISVTLGAVVGLNAKGPSPQSPLTSTNSSTQSSSSSPVTASVNPPPTPWPTVATKPPASEHPSSGPTWDPMTPPSFPITTVPTISSVVDLFWSNLPPYSKELAETDPDSPQAKAMTWLQNDPMYDDYPNVYRLNQRYALAVLFLSTNGTSWNNSTGWLSNDNECSWYHYNVSWPEDNGCAEGYRFSVLDLWENGLEGSVPAELGLLTDLEYVRLFGDLAGTIPSEMFVS
jgi:nitrate reductase NapE component